MAVALVVLGTITFIISPLTSVKDNIKRMLAPTTAAFRYPGYRFRKPVSRFWRHSPENRPRHLRLAAFGRVNWCPNTFPLASCSGCVVVAGDQATAETMRGLTLGVELCR